MRRQVAGVLLAAAALSLAGATELALREVLIAIEQDDAAHATPTVLPTVHSTPIPRATKASRSTVRIPPRLGNDIERPQPARIVPLSNTAIKRYARAKVSATQWVCLHELWRRESNWRPLALGAPTSTGRAGGIPQIKRLDPRTTSPTRQVDRGLAYIAHRYGTPCRALAHHNARHWY